MFAQLCEEFWIWVVTLFSSADFLTDWKTLGCVVGDQTIVYRGCFFSEMLIDDLLLHAVVKKDHMPL